MRRKDRILVASNFQFSQKMEILSTLNTLTPNNEEERSNSNRLELSIFQKNRNFKSFEHFPNNEKERSNSRRFELSIFAKFLAKIENILHTLEVLLIEKRSDRILVPSNFQFSQKWKL